MINNIKVLAVSVAALALASGAHAFGFNFTFDNDNEGWTRGNFGSGFANITTGTDAVNWVSESGNGYLEGVDHGAFAFNFSPNLGGGHGGLFGTDLTYDFRTQFNGGLLPKLVLMSSTDFLTLTEQIPATDDFVSYARKLDSSEGWFYNSSTWYNGGNAVLATDGDIQSVLNDLQFIGISSDVANGSDLVWIDNVQAVPEPATMLALGIGALAMVRRKRSAR